MSDEGQRTFGDFQDEGAGDDRPADEAAAIAGNGGSGTTVVDIDERQFPDTSETVEFVVTQVDYTVEGRGDDEFPVVHVFGRTEDGAPVHARVYEFEPYFYVPVDSVTEDRLRQYDRIVDWRYEDENGDPFESIRGERLLKIIGQTPRDVGQMRDDFDHYEADILFPNRLLIDKDITSGVRVPARELDDGSYKVHHEEIAPVEASADPRVNTFDIEVDDRHGFPEDGEQTIVCLTSHDSYDDEYVVWLYESPDGIEGPEALAAYDPIREDADFEADVRVFESEERMLEAFADYIVETDPDVLTGWNCLPGDSEILMGDGTVKAIEDIEIGDTVVGSDDQEPTVATVTNRWVSEKEVLEFDLGDGTSIRSSAEHRLMVGDDEVVDWTEAADVEPGDYVLKPRRLNVPDTSVPTLRSLIPTEKQRYQNDDTIRRFKAELPHGAISELEAEFGTKKETLYHPTPSTWTPERCRVAADMFGLAVPDGGRVYRKTGADLDRELTPSELYLAGLVLTDGSMSIADGIRFYNTRTELHEQFPGDASLTPDGTGCYKQNVLDYARLHAFNGLGIPFGDKNATDVDLSTVYEMPEEYIAHFLAGVVDGDGSVHNSVTVAAENGTVGDWYVKLFKRLGIYAERRDNVVRVPDAARDVQRLKQRVLPHMAHSEKVEQLAALEGGKSGRSENVPYALFEADTGTDEKRIGRDKHRRGINLKRHETNSQQWDEFVFVEVEDVTVADTETTYDIETTTHNFLADDCLVHNCDDFDIPYYLDRLEELQSYDHDYDLDIDRLSRVDEVWRSGWGGPDIKGRVVFDLLYAYKRTQFTELESYRLDAVGEQELGVGKERYTGDIGDLWEQDPERLLEYNLRDVELCVELDREQDIVDFWDEVRTFVGCKLEDATTPGDAVDMYVLHKLYGEYALPSKGKQDSEDYEGGAVFDPITGVRENVTVLDLKCFSGDTEVMTPDGARNIRDIEAGESVYTLNPDTFECEVKPVEETHQYENSFGELHHLSGNTHDFKVTENHRFLASAERGWDDQTPEDFEFSEYRDIPDHERFAFPQHEPMDGESPETFELVDEAEGGYVVVYTDADLREFRNAVPDDVRDSLDLIHGSSERMGVQKSVGKYLVPLDVYRQHESAIAEHADDMFLKFGRGHRETPLSFAIEDWLEFLGWFVTEGSTDAPNDRLTLHQSGNAGREAIQELLDRMDINYNVDERGINVSNRYLVDWVVDNCGDGYESKQLPDWVFGLDGDLLTVLLNTMIRGDGSRSESGLGKFWTKSPHLRDAAADIAIRCGQKPTVSRQSDGTWYVSVGKRGSFKKSSNATTEDHDGDVYCITARDNHVVLAGRNGNFQWVGQSLYPMCMVTTNASPETKVDPDAYDGDTYVAPNGTHFRKEPDGVIREMVDELLTEREEKKEQRNSFSPENPEYERYDRQQAAVKVIMNCFTPDTDVLTPEGIRNIRDLEIGDEVYSLDPGTMEMEIKPVVETQAYPNYRGELIDIETSKVDFRVTPNHRMLVRKNETNGTSEDEYRFVEAGELDDATNYELPHDWEGPAGERLDAVDLTEFVDDYEVWVRPSVHGHSFAAELGYYPDKVLKNDLGKEGYVFGPDEFERHREYIESVAETTFVHAEAGRKWIPRTFDGDDFLELLAWYITEGNVYTSETKQFGETTRGAATTVKIAQDAIADGGEGHHASIGDLLDRMGFDYYVDDRAYQFTSKLLGDLLCDLGGSGSFEKRIPEFVFEASQRQKRRFLDTLVDGDGDRQPNSWRYSTASDRLRDDVLRLCAHLGLTANYSEDSGAWRVHVTENGKNTLRMHRSGGISTAADGVYCVTVADNHTLMAGRNGTFQFVGQSLYGVLGWDRFRLYDKEMGAAVTATGREVIDYTDEVVENEGYEVVYGDTDSVMLQLGDISADDVEADVSVTDEMRAKHPEMDDDELELIAATISKGFELEDTINASYDEFALERLNAQFHRFEIEFEKLYRRFFQAGKKKRYAGHSVWKEGKHVDDIDITGFEYQRSDIAPITKRVQKEVIDRIVHGEDAQNIKDYVAEVIEDYQDGNVDYDDVGIPGGIGKKLDNYDTDTAQVRGAKYANLLLGTNFQSGSKPKRLYLDRVHADFFERVEDELGLDPKRDPLYGEFRRDPDVICFEYADQIPEEFEIDWDKMLDKTLKGPIARILEALDISWDEVKSGQEQTGLGQYM